MQGYHRQICDIRNVLSTNRNCQRLWFQSLTMTHLTWCHGHIRLIVLLNRFCSRLSVPALQIPKQSLVVCIKCIFSVIGTLIVHIDFLSFGSVQDHMLCLFRQILKWYIQREFVFFRQCFETCMCIALLIPTGLPARYGDCPFIQSQTVVRDNQINIKFCLESKSSTTRTCAKWIVEREASRLDLLNADTTIRAGEAIGK